MKFQTFGCGAAIAVSSIVSEMAMGKLLDEAVKITNEDVAEELGGLPKNKLHCSNLGADALRKAIENYREHSHAVDESEKEKSIPKKESSCPYCDGPKEGYEEICRSCNLEIDNCQDCGKPIPKESKKCPHCGATKVRV